MDGFFLESRSSGKENKPAIFTRNDADQQMKTGTPEWLTLLLRKEFFQACPGHSDLENNRLNAYCSDCDQAMCPNCLPSIHSERGHWVLQIRRCDYQNVVSVDDIQNLVDCSMIKQVISNSFKVVQLKPWKNPQHWNRGRGRSCRICKNDMKTDKYCSLACKISEEVPFQPTTNSQNKNNNIRCLSLEANESSSSSLLEEDFVSPGLLMESNYRKRNRKGTPRRAPMF